MDEQKRTRQVSVYLTPDEHKELRVLAATNDKSMSDAGRDFVLAGIRPEPPETADCGLCNGPCTNSDHGFCKIHNVWFRDNGGRFVGDPHICYPGMPQTREFCGEPGPHH